MKVYIVTDLEGVAGIVLPSQVRPGTREYEEARHLLTCEVNSAVEGILSVVDADIYVNDGHDGGFNIILDELHEGAKIVAGRPRYFSLGGFDETFDAMFLVGYHSRAGADRGILSHTMSSEAIYRVFVNRAEVGEIGIMAMLAGYYRVPVALVTGDASAADEAKRLLGEVECAIVKWGLGRSYGISLSPRKSRRVIRESSIRAMRLLNRFKPLVLPPPYEVVVEYTRAEFAEMRLRTRGVERIDERTIKASSDDLREAFARAGLC